MEVVAGVDLGGTAVNYSLVNAKEQFLIDGLCEHPALAKQGPQVCLQQIEDGLRIAAEKAEPGSRQPSTAGTTRMWAVEEIGSNSVMPWTTPNIPT